MKIWANTKTLDGYIDDLELTDNINLADIALLGSKPIDLSKFPKLKGIFRAGVSQDNVPEEEAKKRGVKVCYPSEKTINYIYEETAAFTCYLILKMLYKDTGTLDPWVKYDRSALSTKRLLVIGKGNIGKRVIDKTEKFMIVDTYDIRENSTDELKNKIENADCITLHIPNVPENRCFIDKPKLDWMKTGSVLINTARGTVVSEDALYESVKNNKVKAAFDVYWKEPYEGKLKAFYPHKFEMTPHIASTCREFLLGAAEDLKNFIQVL